MLGILTQEDAQSILDEITVLKAEQIKLRQDFTSLIEEIKKSKK